MSKSQKHRDNLKEQISDYVPREVIVNTHPSVIIKHLPVIGVAYISSYRDFTDFVKSNSLQLTSIMFYHVDIDFTRFQQVDGYKFSGVMCSLTAPVHPNFEEIFRNVALRIRP